jgi:4a-hydroxytetrahydrobiopterin dehydratase
MGLSTEEKANLLKSIHTDWELTHQKTRLTRRVKLRQMAEPMRIANLLAAMADEEWHHPELRIGFGYLEVEIWTHTENDVVENDFTFASKVDEILKKEVNL